MCEHIFFKRGFNTEFNSGTQAFSTPLQRFSASQNFLPELQTDHKWGGGGEGGGISHALCHSNTAFCRTQLQSRMCVKDIFVDTRCENEYQVDFNYTSLYNANSTNFPLESTINHTTFSFYSFFLTI